MREWQAQIAPPFRALRVEAAIHRRSVFDISWSAIGKVVVAAALVWAWMHLWQFVMVLITAAIIAVAIHPAVVWLERRGIPCGVGALAAVLMLAGVMTAVLVAGWVTIRDQSALIVQRLGEFATEIRASVPALDYVMPSGGGAGTDGVSQLALNLARSASSATGMVVVALALTVYFLVEWKRTVEWLIAFTPESARPKLRRTITEARGIMFRYAVGNLIASAITGVATYIALSALRVPAALMLAVISGLLNFVPIIGFFISGGMAMVLAATVSLKAALLVAAFYIVFNAIESYLIAPKVFGRELELSDLAVLIAVIVGAELGGVMGALLALPLAALYPTIERIWLRERLSADTVDIHDRLSA